MPAPDLTDDELDLRLRSAAAALAGLAPAGRVDELALRVEAELAALDSRPVISQPVIPPAVTQPLESRMTSDTDEKSGPANVTPPSGRAEDSGLHDIKALAQDTRRRISRRITSQHDIDPDLLASSTGSMRMIALPEPAMVVALPEAPTTMEAVREAMKDPAMAAAAAAVPIQRKRTTLWVGLGAAAVAAAAAAVIIAGGGGSDDKKSSSQIAANGTAAGPTVKSMEAAAASGSAMVAAAAPVPETMSGAAADPATAPAATGGGSAQITPATPPGGGSATAGSAAVGSAKAVDKVADKGPRGGSADVKPAGGSAAKPGGDAKSAGGGSAKPAGGGGAAAGAGTGGNKGEKSIEDLLNDASGGSKPKDTSGGGGGGDSAPTGPTKTSLEPKEIKAGMSAVAGAAQSCFGKHGVSGHVKVKATVTSSGSVSKVDATGEFAGTPTGACVAGAVKGASFPSWTGAPMTVTYSFTLQE